MTRRHHKRRDERGFALLLVFLMAAAVAVMLYRQLPRVAFESQRDKEETLIERGEQYKRAVQLYYLAFSKFPAKIEDLENTNNKRYLRHRYVDPMTGKDEWRLIHVNAAGMLTDSAVVKPPAPGDAPNPLAQNTNTNTNPGGFGTNPATPGANPATGAPPEVNATVFRRPSDRPVVGGSGMNPNPVNADPNDPRNWPPITLQQTQQPGQPGQVNGQPPQQFQPGSNPQFPGQQFPGQQFPGQQYPGQPYPGQPQQFNGQVSGQPIPGQNPLPPGVVQSTISGQMFPGQPGVQPVPGMPPLPGQPGFNPQSGGFGPDGQWVPNDPSASNGANSGGQPGFPVQVQNPQQGIDPNGGTGNSAIPLINNMLRTPRQAPAPPVQNQQQAGPGAGLVGVASTFEGPSIKVYDKHQKYNEWEFVFKLGTAGRGLPQPNNPLGTPQPNQPGTLQQPTQSTQTSPFGTPQR